MFVFPGFVSMPVSVAFSDQLTVFLLFAFFTLFDSTSHKKPPVILGVDAIGSSAGRPADVPD